MTGAPQAAAGRRAARPARALWIVAGDCAILALASAQALRGDQRLVVALTCATLAMAIVVVLAAREIAIAAKTGALVRLALGVGGAGAALTALWIGQAALGGRAVALALAAFVGLALVLRWLVASVERGDAYAAPWRELAAGTPPPPPGRRRDAVFGVLGAVLLIAAGIVAAQYAVDGRSPLRGLVAGVVVAAVLMAVVAGPIALVSQVRARRAWADRERGRQRQAVAAHLHDSVLQTLALIQRSAHDAQRVQHLARQQERGLRAWLAGRDDAPEDSVSAALSVVAAEVEDESAGAATIEVIPVADVPMSASADALVQAAREALRNATRHAGGVVRVVVDPQPEALIVFIRDAGGGFDLAHVSPERRGIRDAIIGRMEHAGGQATIESGAEGTEIELRVPLAPEREAS